MEPLISVIVPVYKVEKYLEKCIDSILAQTYKNLEIILVDDGSPDRCGQICDEYAQKDNRVKVIHKENGGLSDARNAGIDVAKGDFISFVDSDDYILPEMMGEMISAAMKNNCDMAICGVYRELKNKCEEQHFFEKQTILTQEELFQMCFEDSLPSYAWNKITKKECWNNIRFKVGITWEDIELFPRLLNVVHKAIYIDSPMYVYNCTRTDSICNDISKRYINAYNIANSFLSRIEYAEKNYPKFKNEAINVFLTHGLTAVGISGGLDEDKQADIILIKKYIKSISLKYVIAQKRVSNKTKFKFCLLKLSERLFNFIYKILYKNNTN